mgnify:CR=1 FL=1
MFKAGVAGGYSEGNYDVHSLQASMQGETVHVGGYLGYEGEAAFAGLFGAYQKSDFNSMRQVTAANTRPLTAQADIDMTQQIADVAGLLGLVIHDHIIVGRSGHVSLRSKGLI